ncbi:phosphatase PAP2 family protein [Autumnicola musiva]|uniref:Phosphatase PAP2 family protein n=1 Tax=Autumnicola musiva TaxID=3075589 RepID=A0ABU3D4F0_9FLAO|nr:phosphatase PAP2 family protein [Zunongwangia sp. F117]MDT0676403.1 phosphatase PAP2 family protein [Zunongwangia sp. F117]
MKSIFKTPNKLLPIFLALFLCFNTTKAQVVKRDSLPSSWELLKYDGISAFGGIKNTYTQPLRWKKEDFITAGAVVLGTAALYIIDEQSSDWFIAQEKDIPPLIRDIGWYSGKPVNNYSLTSAIYLYGLFTKNEKVRKTGVLLISAATAAGLLQTFTKTALGRARPGVGEGKWSFKPFSEEEGYHTFPSGHTILSFTTAYAIGKQFDNPFVKGGIYTLGLIAPASRLWAGAHWLTDIGLSIAISIAVVDTIDNYLNRDRNYGNIDPHKTKISWDFQMGPGRIGIRGTF